MVGTISVKSTNVVATMELDWSNVEMFSFGNDDNVCELGMNFMFWNDCRVKSFDDEFAVHELSC